VTFSIIGGGFHQILLALGEERRLVEGILVVQSVFMTVSLVCDYK